MGSDELLEHLLGPDRDHAADDPVVAAHLTLYRQFWGRLTPLPGAQDLLRRCARRGQAVVLASSASPDELDALRAALDVDDAVTVATSSSDAEAGKPAPDILAAALEQAGVAADRAVFVGDAVWDGAAAGCAGVPFIGLTCGGTPAGALREAGALEVWRDPAELLARLPADG
jgi:HAD superfamily hydrolase (TIGR01509 family)